MKRIIAALKGKLEAVQLERKQKRFERGIDTAVDNAYDALDRIEEEKARIASTIATANDIPSVINRLSQKFDEQEEQEAIIERLKKIKAYMNEDVNPSENAEKE